MTEPLFPFTLRAIETPHYTHNPQGFRDTWLAIKPAALVWFAYDVIVHSATEIEFVIYGMRCTAEGGIGDKEGSFKTKVAKSVTKAAIARRAAQLARWRRDQELDDAEQKIVDGYAAEILRENGLK